MPDDAEPVRALIGGILAQEFPAETGAYPAADLAHVASAYGGPREVFWVAEVQGQLVGTCAVKDEGAEGALLRRLFVHPQHRARGIGARLVDAAIAHCRRQGFRDLTIRTSNRMQQAMALCVRRGFREEERLALGPVQLVRFTLRITPHG